jgi:hypothetical protein
VGEHAWPVARVDAAVVVRLPRQVLLAPVDVELRVIVDPWVVEGGVVGYEVEHQPHATRLEALAHLGEGLWPAKVAVHGVVADGEGRTHHVIRREIGKQLPILPLPVGLV